MKSESLEQIEALYKQLESLVFGLGTAVTGERTVGGPFNQYKAILEKLGTITGHDFKDYIPRQYLAKRNETNGDYACSTRDLIAQINGLLGFLRGNYFKNKEPHFQSNVSPTQQVNVNQDVAVTQSVVLDISDFLNGKQLEYQQDSKEDRFIEKVKSGLRSVKNTAGLIGLIAQTAVEIGLTATELAKIFK